MSYIASARASCSNESSSGEIYLIELYSFFGWLKNASTTALWYLTLIKLTVQSKSKNGLKVKKKITLLWIRTLIFDLGYVKFEIFSKNSLKNGVGVSIKIPIVTSGHLSV